MKKTRKLFRRNKNGSTQVWEIFVDGDSFYTVEGILGGKLTTSKPTKCLPKNVGKKNQRTAEEQAEFEAEAKYQRKLEKDYVTSLAELLTYQAEKTPMLAKDAKLKDLTFRVKTFVQPKLDGIRCISKNGKLLSRNNKLIVSCPHLHQSIDEFDGELYNHDYHDDFNKIVSMVKKTKLSEDEFNFNRDNVQHWVYDLPSYPGPFADRFEALKLKFSQGLMPEGYQLVETYEVNSVEDVERYHEEFLSRGFEGTIIRVNTNKYEYDTRSYQLLKYKDFIDSEFKIVGFIEGKGNRAGTIGKFVLDLGCDGKTFESNVKASFPELTQMWINRESYIGKMATVKYFKLTPAGVPRFPYIIKFDRESYE